MCDYSLMEFSSRLGAEGERLQVHQFSTGSKGLISALPLQRQTTQSFWQSIKDFFTETPDQGVCAICIPPGATLTLHDIPKNLQEFLSVSDTEKVTFIQQHAEPYQHRDAIQFKNGRVASLQELTPGQHLDVVDLSVPEEYLETRAHNNYPVYEVINR